MACRARRGPAAYAGSLAGFLPTAGYPVPFSIEFFGHTLSGTVSLALSVVLVVASVALFLAFPGISGWRRLAAAYPAAAGPRTHAASTFTTDVSWTLGLAVRTSLHRVEVLDTGVRLTPGLNLYRFPSVLLPWSRISSCTPDLRLSTEVDGARHTALRMADGKVIVRLPNEAGDRVAAEWRLLKAPTSGRPPRPGQADRASTAS